MNFSRTELNKSEQQHHHHRLRVVVTVSHSTRPSLSPFPYGANSFILGTAVINNNAGAPGRRKHLFVSRVNDTIEGPGYALKPDESEGCSPVSSGQSDCARLDRLTTSLPHFDPR
jgi:hypothetical protein